MAKAHGKAGHLSDMNNRIGIGHEVAAQGVRLRAQGEKTEDMQGWDGDFGFTEGEVP